MKNRLTIEFFWDSKRFEEFHVFRAPFYPWRPHPWHGLDPGPDAPEVVQAYIEVTPFDLVIARSVLDQPDWGIINMAIRVLQIIPTLDRCGAEKQMCLLAAGLPRDAFDVHVCVLTRNGPLHEELDAAGVPYSLIDKSWKIDPAAYLRLKREIKRLSPDIVHTWIFAANSYGRRAAIAARVPHIVAGERCVDRWKAEYEFAIDRHLAKRTDRIATNSSGVRDFYVKHGLPADKFAVIPNGIRPCETMDGASREELLEKLGLPPDVKLIGTIGRLWPQKRYKDLIWAAEMLRIVRDDTHMLIIGDGPQRWRLERFRDLIGSRDRIHFLGERDDVPRLLPHFDCFWLGSAYEGQSNSLMEAMLAGRPVIATDIPGNRDLVIPEETGYLVRVGDRAAFVRKTLEVLNDPELSGRVGEAAKQRMLTEFTVEKMVERYAAMYRELADD